MVVPDFRAHRQMTEVLDTVPLITLRYSPNSAVEIEGTREALVSDLPVFPIS